MYNGKIKQNVLFFKIYNRENAAKSKITLSLKRM